MYKWASDLFPICRSLSGDGVRETFQYIKTILPALRIHEVPSGTKAFDWTVPDEWNIRDAFVADENGNRIIDFRVNNLHVVGYSEPVDAVMTFGELDAHLYSLPDQPNAINYVTSYYNRRWGFSISENQRNAFRKMPTAKYHVKIDSTLEPGHLTYGELIIPGMSDKEILLSTYICHPSMANNELSGPCVATALAEWLQSKERKYTYRLLYVPETIGAIIYLSRHLDELKKNVIAGFVLSCLGDDRDYSLICTPDENTLADRVANLVLKHYYPAYSRYSFLARGSDERQYCAPGVELPVVGICRTKYLAYPEYHTSLDNLALISPSGLEGGYTVIKKIIEALEMNECYKSTAFCEPQLGKRGLYPTISAKNSYDEVEDMMNLLAYTNGKRDLIEIAEKNRQRYCQVF